MANYVIKKTSQVPGHETTYWQEQFSTWTIATDNRTVYTSKAKVDAALAMVPTAGNISGVTTAIQL